MNQSFNKLILPFSSRLFFCIICFWAVCGYAAAPIAREVSQTSNLFKTNNVNDIAKVFTIIEHDSVGFMSLADERVLDQWAEVISDRIQTDDLLSAKIKKINHFIFVEQEFRYDINDQEAIDPHNFYLSSVIHQRKGICTGLSFLYIALAQKLGIKAQGVHVPGHFYVRFIDEDQIIDIDPALGGKQLLKILEKNSLSSEELTSFILTHHAFFLMEQKRFDEAELYLSDAMNLNVHNTRALYLKSVLLVFQNQMNEALQLSQKILSMEPRNAEALNLSATLLALIGYPKQAITYAQKAVQLKPGHEFYAVTLANIFAMYGQQHRAQIVLDQNQKFNINRSN